MSRYDTQVSADAWDELIVDLKALGPSPDQNEVMTALLSKIWNTEGITLDEDHR